MYFNPSTGLCFETRKQAKQHYGVSRFRRMLHQREILFTPNIIANDELHHPSQKPYTDKE